MFSTKKAKKTGTHTLTQCHKTFLSPFFFFFLFPLTLIFLYLSPSFFSTSPLCFSPCYSPKLLHKPNNKNQDLDLRRRSPSSPNATYLVGIVTQCRKISSDVLWQRRFVIMETCSDPKKVWEQQNRTRGDLNSEKNLRVIVNFQSLICHSFPFSFFP